jgi:hypothetical protein
LNFKLKKNKVSQSMTPFSTQMSAPSREAPGDVLVAASLVVAGPRRTTRNSKRSFLKTWFPMR